MSLLEKIAVSDKFEWEMCVVMVRHHYDVNELTYHFIKKNKEKLRGVLKASAPLNAKVSCDHSEQIVCV